MVNEFLVHKSAGKARVFALVSGDGRRLEAVTTVAGADAALADDLVAALNTFMANRQDGTLEKVLTKLPDAVTMAVRNFVRDQCPFDLGAYAGYGFNDIVRSHVIFGPLDGLRLIQEFHDYLESAYMIGLGIRFSNAIDDHDRVTWHVELRAEEVFVPSSGQPRTWQLPEGAPVLETWSSARRLESGPAEDAVEFALKASDEGRWVRVHTFMHGSGETELGTSTSEWVVDVFDAPIPLEPADED